MNDDVFKEKVIFELHDIALSLRQISGRSKVTKVEGSKPKSYVQKYFERSTDDKKED